MRALIDTRGVATPSFELVTHSELKANDGLRGFLVAPRCSLAAALVLAAVTGPAFGQRPAVSPNEIRIGATSPITGPTPAYAVQAKVISAYFDKVNAEGGINGRRINMIVYDDGYDPKKSR